MSEPSLRTIVCARFKREMAEIFSSIGLFLKRQCY